MKNKIIATCLFIVLALYIFYENYPAIIEFIGGTQDEVTEKYSYTETY